MTQPSRVHRGRRGPAKRHRRPSKTMALAPVALSPTATPVSTTKTPRPPHRGLQKQEHNAPAELGFSFAGGGWLMCYLFGVAKAVRRHNLHHTARFTGTSAGALAAIGLTLDADFDAITHTVTSSYVPQAHGSLSGPFQMRKYLVDALTRHANLDQYETCNADPLKCTVVYTSLSTFEPRRKSHFDSASHLLETLIASCCATPLVGLPFQFEGEWVIDGGLTENQPRFQSYHNVKRVVNVSPNVLDTDADIRPSQYVPPWWSMYPPSEAELGWVYLLGQKDGHDWCVRNGLADPSVRSYVEALEPRHVGSHIVGQVVGYAWAERFLQVVTTTLVMVLRQRPTAHGLLKVELSVWKWLAVCVAVVDRVMILWTAFVATALVTILSTSGASSSAQECLALACVHLVVWLSRLYDELLQLSKSPQWLEVEHSLRVVESHSASGASELHELNLRTLGRFKRVLPRHHHEALAAKSVLYRISTEFGDPMRTY